MVQTSICEPAEVPNTHNLQQNKNGRCTPAALFSTELYETWKSDRNYLYRSTPKHTSFRNPKYILVKFSANLSLSSDGKQSICRCTVNDDRQKNIHTSPGIWLGESGWMNWRLDYSHCVWGHWWPCGVKFYYIAFPEDRALSLRVWILSCHVNICMECQEQIPSTMFRKSRFKIVTENHSDYEHWETVTLQALSFLNNFSIDSNRHMMQHTKGLEACMVGWLCAHGNAANR